MDLESRKRWIEYSKAKDEMFKFTDLQDTPWWVVHADDKRRARLNCVQALSELRSLRGSDSAAGRTARAPTRCSYVRPPMGAQRFVANHL